MTASRRALVVAVLAALGVATVVGAVGVRHTPHPVVSFGSAVHADTDIALDVDPKRPPTPGAADLGAPEIDIPAGIAARASAVVDVRAAGPRCVATASPCPPRAVPRIRLYVSALLDLTREAMASGKPAVVVAGARPSTVALNLGTLPVGLHCLLVAAMEPPEDTVGHSVPEHGGTALFFLRVGGRGRDYCHAPRSTLPTAPLHLGSDLDLCSFATLSTKTTGLSFRNRDRIGTTRYLPLDPCQAHAVTYAFLRDGAFVGADGGQYRPGSLTRGIARTFAIVTFPDPASWRVVEVWTGVPAAVGVATSRPLIVE